MKKDQKAMILYYTKCLLLTAQLGQPTHPLGQIASFALALAFVVPIDAVPSTWSVLYRGLDKS